MKEFLFKHKTKLFSVTIILAFLSFPLILKLQPDFSYKAWFKKSDRYLKDYELFEKEFGNEDFLSVAIYNKNGVIDQENIDLIKIASEKLAVVHRVRHVDSLTSFKKIYGNESDIYTEEIIPPGKTPDLSEVKSKINSSPIIQDYLINKTNTLSVIYLRMLPVFDRKHEYDKSYSQAENIMKNLTLPKGTEFHLSGSVSVIQGLSKEVKSDVSMISPILLGLIILMTYFLFGSKLVTLIPLVTITATLVMSFAIGSALGVSFNPITSMVPHILMAICVADCIHIISAYFSFYNEYQNKKTAILAAIKKKFAPTLYTSLTTSLGFISLTLTDIKPIFELGIIAGVGTMIAWIVTFTMVPFILYKSNFLLKKEKKSFARKNLFSANYISRLNKYAYHIIFASIILSAIGFSLSKNVHVNSRTSKMLHEDHPIRVGRKLIKKEFGAIASIDVLIHSDKNDLQDVLRKTQTLQTWIDKQYWSTKTISVVDYVKELNMVFEGGNQKDYRMADTSQKNSSLLFLYEIASGNEQESKWITSNKDKTRINVLWRSKGSHEANIIIKTIEDKAKELGISAQVSGKTYLLKGINTYLVDVFVRSIFVAIFLVFIFMYFNLRSFYLTFISMIPNVIPIFFGLGAMYIFNIEIDFAAVMVASVCLGIVIDDTIHFFHGFKFAPGQTMDEKLLYVLNSTGHALINTSIVLIISFLTFLFGKVSLNYNFGILSIVIIFVALLCDLILLPSILLKSKKLVKTNSKTQLDWGQT